MKFFMLICALVSVISAANLDYDEWTKFKSTNRKRYSGSIEESLRFKIFKDNIRKIEEHNAKFESGLVSYKMGITKFADMTHQEFLDMLNFNKVSKPKTSNGNNVFVPPPMEDVSKSIDWRSRGVVTEVKDQGNCGSCWSFSATGSIEGQYAIKNKKLASLSEQNLIDCSSFYGDLGCDGGLMDYAFEYVRDYGLMTEEAYPYIAMEGVCYYSDSDSVVKLESFVDVPKADEDALLAAVSTIGPVSVAVDASDFQLYTEGIMDSTYCGNTILYLNHGVLATGFNTTKDGVDYWIVKNSWGSSWGEEGYIRMIRNKNMCGIATSASYPVLKLK